MFKCVALSSFLALFLGLTACSSYGVIENVAYKDSLPHEDTYSLSSFRNQFNQSNTGSSIILAFSGGGTRAAALSYGVMKELRDTGIPVEGNEVSLLKDVDAISAVSGGSFTAAYYGLYGNTIFNDFESKFLRQDIQKSLIKGVLNPKQWFGKTGRTELAVQQYQAKLFKGATFADMLRPDAPIILINASDLGYGVRFTFTQEYFDLLCSDINSFPIARAVAASSAVPVLFNHIVVKNNHDCNNGSGHWLEQAKFRAQLEKDPELEYTVTGLTSYTDNKKREFAHFVDGGITDNLGLRSMMEFIDVAGGAKPLLQSIGANAVRPKRMVIISVNAATTPEPEMDLSNKQPSLLETVNAMSDIQLHRYNVATLKQIKTQIKLWAKSISTPEQPVEPYFIELNIPAVTDQSTRAFLNQVPTSFSLTDEQVDTLIKTGRELLRDNSEFQRLLSDIGEENL